jgi:nucleoside-diphosphate-sugar epimerase
MKKVLITGASGFIGRPCLKALQSRGFEVHAVSSRAHQDSAQQIIWHRVNLHDYGAVSQLLREVRPATLLHLAWYVEHGKYWSSLENIKWVQSSLHLVQEFIINGGTRLVCAGTCAEYDWNYSLCSESKTPINPSTLYGSCKAGLQTILGALSKEEKIDFAWGRLFFPYGPHEDPKRLIPSTALSLLQGLSATCNNGAVARDFIFVEDAAEIFAALADSKINGTINIASGIPATLASVVDMIARVLNRKDLIEARTASPNSSEPPVLVADVSRLQEIADLPPATTLQEGIERTISSWRQYLNVEVAAK